MSSESSGWRRCSTCKKDIDFEQLHWVCNVSTCNRKRTGMVFCSVSCWEAHVPVMRHRESWAVEKTAPTQAAWAREQAGDAKSQPRPAEPAKREARRTLVRPESTSPARSSEEIPRDVLIVASKMKKYIKAISGMNTSDNCLDILSDHVRALCERAVREAREQERRTVMARDFPDPE